MYWFMWPFVDLPSIKSSVMEKILNFCHKGELSLETESVHHILHTAHHLQVPISTVL